MNKRPESTLMLFARDPASGPVKTRLAATLGADAARAAYRAMLEATMARSARAHVGRRVVCVTPDGAAANFSAGAGGDWEVISQGAGTLGERLMRAGRWASEVGRGPIVFVGADSPDLPDDRLEAARAIGAGEVYFEPAADGGYCLISATRMADGLFEGVDWGTERVLEQSIAAAERAGMRPVIGPGWFDVDHEEDLRELRRRIESSDDRALIRLREQLQSITLREVE